MLSAFNGGNWNPWMQVAERRQGPQKRKIENLGIRRLKWTERRMKICSDLNVQA